MNLKTIYNKITKDIHAVSPVVATLVLIVVAIIGAAAVGAMTGAFTDEVGEQEADVGVVGGSLIIGGSTSVEPVARSLAEGFMAANPGTKITVQTGGSGAGIRAVGNDVIDIGMASRAVSAAEFAAHPGIVGRVVTIGNSSVVLVAHRDTGLAALNNITVAELRELFMNDTRGYMLVGGIVHTTNTNMSNLTAAGITRGIFRSDRSGTGDTFARYIAGGRSAPHGHDDIHAAPNANVSFATGNAGVLADIRAASGRIGGICIGYAVPGEVTISTAPVLRRDRPFQLITNGEPSRIEQAFLDYARSPEAVTHFRRLNVTSILM